MRSPADVEFPAALTAVYEIDLYRHGEGVDFEAFDRFMTGVETTQWLRDWTGNEAVSGSPFCVFGQDGTGGYAAFWLIRAEASVVEQPIVFLGSEGETGVVAGNLSEFLWLLADGLGPCEAVEHEGWSSEPTPGLKAIAERYATPPKRTGANVIASARSEFPDFVSTVQALCR